MATDNINLFLSRSHASTATNMTGTWRFMRPVYSEKTAPCRAACPLGVDIAHVQRLTATGQYAAAGEQLLNENPFPAICGHVCFHPCETVCHRAGLDQAIAINRIERFIGYHLIATDARVPYPDVDPRGLNIAIVGAGPAGLSAAYFLKTLGFRCDIYEAQTEPGGLLRWAIPGYRLPLDVLKNELRRITQAGVSIHCGHKVDANRCTRFLDRYDAVFIGCGHAHSLSLAIPGAMAAKDGLAFLKQMRTASIDSMRGRAVVIGGGNSAIDVARSLSRLGVEVEIIYRRRRQDMPAFAPEIERALAEGIVIKELLAPLEIKSLATGCNLTLQVMQVVDHDPQTNQARVAPLSGETQTMQADFIFTAIGAEADPVWQPPSASIHEAIHLTHCTLTMDHQKPVAFGGDLTNRNLSVADAIGSGKQAAMALDTFFSSGWTTIEKRLADCRIGPGAPLSMEIYTKGPRPAPQKQVVAFEHLNLDYFELDGKSERSSASAETRDPIASFDEVQREAKRCFNCGICNECDNCRIYCPEIAVKMTPTGRQIDLDYCKGCGICVTECPRDAMTLVTETS